MITRPGKYIWWNHFAEEATKNLSINEDVVPAYFGDMWAGPTGLRDPSGDQRCLTADLPFTRTITESIPIEDGKFSLNPIASQMTPIIKTPLERTMRHQFFKELPLTDEKTNFPDAWAKLGLEEVGRKLGVVDKKGRIAEDDAYFAEQYLPGLARLRRLFASEKQFKDRQQSSILSFLGVPLRANTKEEQRKERLRRYFEEKQPQKITKYIPKGADPDDYILINKNR